MNDITSETFIPNAPIFCLHNNTITTLNLEGEVKNLTLEQGVKFAIDNPCIICNRPFVEGNLNVNIRFYYDVLELFAFLRPCSFCPPTIKGLAENLGIPCPKTTEQEAQTLLGCVKKLLAEIPKNQNLEQFCYPLLKAGWKWAEFILLNMGKNLEEMPHSKTVHRPFMIWNKLSEISDFIPVFPPGDGSVTEKQALDRLNLLLAQGESEAREEQKAYTTAMCHSFEPKKNKSCPNIVLANAGTGIGKTLGYIAPASVWAEKNQGAVWISTFTKNLQKQIDEELDKLYLDKKIKHKKVISRKGRENYLCLLNFEEAVSHLNNNPSLTLYLAIIARWALNTRDGDLIGGDFPSWLNDILGKNKISALTDHRGECFYSACPHYKKCFIEKNIRCAKYAEIIISNHALTLNNSMQNYDTEDLINRYVFDEGHHLFDTANDVFSSHITGFEGAELRRWLLGSGVKGQNDALRIRGLKNRLKDVIEGNSKACDYLNLALKAALCLPDFGWQRRINANNALGSFEEFLMLVKDEVYKRAVNNEKNYNIECEIFPSSNLLINAAENLAKELKNIEYPLTRLILELKKILEVKIKELSTLERNRIDAIINSINKRVIITINTWIAMIETLKQGLPNDKFCDFFEIERAGGYDIDCGFHRHWVNPMYPFSLAFKHKVHGMIITSATLVDKSGTLENDKKSMEIFSGIKDLMKDENLYQPFYVNIKSPFDYQNQTKIFIVNDINKNSANDVAKAYAELFKASKGGALGLFTSIERLKSVYQKIKTEVNNQEIALYSQHNDNLSLSTLIDIFKAEENSCLLGTDALRDGIDVPGNGLRMVVFDRVPWPRPNILQKARCDKFGKEYYTDMLTRLKLAQAYGRIIRKANDKGVFVILDKSTPSRLLSAFPDGVTVKRCGIAQALEDIGSFF